MLDTKLLVIDNDPNICELLKVYFENEGYDVKTVNDGIEGINFFKMYEPDLVLLDITLPKKDGYQVMDGKLIGASDFQKNSDADAFVDEKQQKQEQQKAKFTGPSQKQDGANEMTKEKIMAVTDRAERRRLISENINLFSKGE